MRSGRSLSTDNDRERLLKSGVRAWQEGQMFSPVPSSVGSVRFAFRGSAGNRLFAAVRIVYSPREGRPPTEFGRYQRSIIQVPNLNDPPHAVIAALVLGELVGDYSHRASGTTHYFQL